MSVLHIFVGQCGNQIGASMWKYLDAEPEETRKPFESRPKVLRCFMIDTEPKVVKILSRPDIPKDQVLHDKTGRGNNWAMGYVHSGQTAGRSIASWDDPDDRSIIRNVMIAIRKNIERAENHEGCVVYHSLAGGTGSGLGCRIVEELRKDYPRHYILSVAVAPFTKGETPLQNYNSLLSLTTLQRSADGILLFHNEELMRVLTKSKMFGRGTNPKGPLTTGPPPASIKVSLEDLNNYIALCLCGLFFPLKIRKEKIESTTADDNLQEEDDQVSQENPSETESKESKESTDPKEVKGEVTRKAAGQEKAQVKSTTANRLPKSGSIPPQPVRGVRRQTQVTTGVKLKDPTPPTSASSTSTPSTTPKAEANPSSTAKRPDSKKPKAVLIKYRFETEAFSLADLICTCCPDPALKFLDVWSTLPSRADDFFPSWQSDFDKFVSIYPKYDMNDKKVTNLQSRVIVRGDEDDSFSPFQQMTVDKFIQTYKFVNWNEAPVELKLSASPGFVVDQSVLSIYHLFHILIDVRSFSSRWYLYDSPQRASLEATIMNLNYFSRHFMPQVSYLVLGFSQSAPTPHVILGYFSTHLNDLSPCMKLEHICSGTRGMDVEKNDSNLLFSACTRLYNPTKPSPQIREQMIDSSAHFSRRIINHFLT